MDLPLFLDWFAVTIDMPEDWDGSAIVPLSGCSVHEQGGTRVWGRRALLLDDTGVKVATALWAPKSAKVIGEKKLLFEVANEWLYHGRGPVGMVREFCALNHARCVGFSRIDFATDFEMSEELFAVVEGLSKGIYEVGGKSRGANFWTKTTDARLPSFYHGRRFPHSQSWGAVQSSVSWKVYYKWWELCEAAGAVGHEKGYIVDRWVELGLDPRKVWRLEVSVKHSRHLEWDGIRMGLEEVNKMAVDVFRSLYRSRFCIREATGKSRACREKVVPFLHVPKAGKIVKGYRYLEQKSREAEKTLMNTLIRSLDEERVLMNDRLRERVMWMVGEVIEAEGLKAYADRVVDDDVWSWMEELRVKAEGLKSGSLSCSPSSKSPLR